MKTLPSDLRKKADGLLRVYGGIDGLSHNPPWVIGVVLKTWFTEAERKPLVEFMLHGARREVKVPLLRELGLLKATRKG